MRYAIGRADLRECGMGALGERGLALGQDLELVLEGLVQVKILGRAGDQSGLGEPLERVRNRRPLGRDQLAEQAMGERQREADTGGLDPPPAAGEVPQQQNQTNLQPRLRGDRPQDVELERCAGTLAAPATRGSAGTAARARRSLRRARRAWSGATRASHRCSREAGPVPGRAVAAGRPDRPARPRCDRRPGPRRRASRRESAARGPRSEASNQGCELARPDRLPGGPARSRAGVRRSSRARRTPRPALRRRRADTCTARTTRAARQPAADGGATATVPAGQPLGLRRTQRGLSGLSDLPALKWSLCALRSPPTQVPRLIGNPAYRASQSGLIE